MADPSNSSTETAENQSNDRTLSDIDSDTLSDLDDSMSGTDPVKKDDEGFDDGDDILGVEDNTKIIGNTIPFTLSQVQTVSGPSSYYPEITSNFEQISENKGQDTETMHDHPFRRQTRPRTRNTELVLNKHTCVRKNTKRKPFNDKQISELEKEFQKTRLSSPLRSSQDDFFDLTPESDDNDGYQQQALSDENYVDLNDIILRNIPLVNEEKEKDDSNGLQEKEELPPWLQLDYRDLQSYYGIGRLVSDNIIYGTESVFKNLDSVDEDEDQFN